ncbi:MAG TPA: hypothetical protein VFO34_14940, partial [Candidatus Acidoferrales bacterium]|nr:hypothetical protein [Candidatus Acidoferrales bacterium]
MIRSNRISLCTAMIFCTMLLAAPSHAQEVSYDLSFGAPNSHLIDVAIRAGGLNGSVDFSMPAWAPGWYVINDYAKFVQGFSAKSPAGAPLAWHKTDKQTWRIDLGSSNAVTVSYRVYGNTPGVDSMQFNSSHVHIPGPAVWMYLINGKQRPAKLTIHPPNGWKIATGMTAEGQYSFSAPDYDTFIDCPIEISDFAEKAFDLDGTIYHVVVHDIAGKKDFSDFAANLQKAVQQLVAIDAPVAGTSARKAPFAQYYFLFHIMPNTGGGLEHLNSTQIFLGSDWDADSFAGSA